MLIRMAAQQLTLPPADYAMAAHRMPLLLTTLLTDCPLGFTLPRSRSSADQAHSKPTATARAVFSGG